MNSCRSCGIEIPEGQDFCSMCYGDPAYGRDGYYQEWIDQCEKQQEERRQEEEVYQQMINEEQQKEKLIENGNYGDNPDHKDLEHGKDAFGNVIMPEAGYRLLQENEIIQEGDKHFDIYNGWESSADDYGIKNKQQAYGRGRWRCWERLI